MKEVWQMTLNEYFNTKKELFCKTYPEVKDIKLNAVGRWTRTFGENIKIEHRQIIEQALAENKPVPIEVLTGYTELK